MRAPRKPLVAEEGSERRASEGEDGGVRLRRLHHTPMSAAGAASASAVLVAVGNGVVVAGRRWGHAEVITLIFVPVIGLAERMYYIAGAGGGKTSDFASWLSTHRRAFLEGWCFWPSQSPLAWERLPWSRLTTIRA